MSVVEGYGFITLSRKVFSEHSPYWCEFREFSKFEAWLDIIQSAAYADHERVIRGRKVLIPRGSLVASERFLLRRWGWKSVGKVRRFLVALVNDGRIERDAKTERITVCNYDVYQPERSSNGAATEQQRSSDGAKIKKVRKGKKGRTPPLFPPDFVAAIPNIADLWAKRMECAKTKPNESAEQAQVDKLANVCREFGAAPVLRAIEDATGGGYQGIFPDRYTKAQTHRPYPENDPYFGVDVG